MLPIRRGAIAVCAVCGGCLPRARMFFASAGASEVCGLCGDVARVADAVDASTLSADEEEVARRLLHQVRAMLEGHRDPSTLGLGRGGQRSGPYQPVVRGGASVAERTEPASLGGGQ